MAGCQHERAFARVATVDRWSSEGVEIRRRSLAMLPPGAQAGWTREEAIEVLEQLQWCRSCGRRLRAALQDVVKSADRTLRSLSLGRPGSKT